MKIVYSIIFEISDNSNKIKLINKIVVSYPYALITQNSYFVIVNKDITPLETHVTIRDNLKEFIKLGDKLYVGVVKSPAAWSGLDTEVSEWLRSQLSP